MPEGISVLLDEKRLEEYINKGREVDDKLKKIANKARLEKLALGKKYKKKAREDEEMLAVKRKYKELRKGLYEERREHIKSIPHFWSTAFLSYTRLREHLSNEDLKIIKFLNSVVVDEDGQNDNSVTFFFDDNQYFENPCLTKIYSHTRKGIVYKSGTKILWKKDTDTTTGSEKEILVQKGSIHPLTVTDIDKSFFTRFFDPQDNVVSKKFCDEVRKEIKEHLWPYVLVHFLNATKKEE